MTVTALLLARDESGRIEHALASLEPLVDDALVVDTGSADDTRELARAAGATVIERPWVSFAHNRSEALQLARDRGGYLLMVDADMTVLETGARHDLTADAYTVPVLDGLRTWRLPLLTRAAHPFEYRGAAHAYLASDVPSTQEPTDWVAVQGGKGASREKLERDVVALTAAFADDPSDARTVFYLARSHDDLDHVDDAIRWYRLRVQMGGWPEEVYYARYRLGCLLSTHVSFADGAAELLAAWDDARHRAEALRALATAAAAVADKTPLPDDGLFLHPDAYGRAA